MNTSHKVIVSRRLIVIFTVVPLMLGLHLNALVSLVIIEYGDFVLGVVHFSYRPPYGPIVMSNLCSR